MRTLIKRLTSKTLLVNESSGANEEDSFQRATTTFVGLWGFPSLPTSTAS